MNLAVNQTKAGDYYKAETTLQQALIFNETELGPDHVTVAKILTNLGILAAMQGRPDEAGPRFERALGVLETRLGEDHPNVLRMRTNLAVNLMEQGKLEEAEPIFDALPCAL